MAQQLYLLIFKDRSNPENIIWHTYRKGGHTREERNTGIESNIYKLSKGAEFMSSDSLKRGAIGNLIPQTKRHLLNVELSDIWIMESTPEDFTIE